VVLNQNEKMRRIRYATCGRMLNQYTHKNQSPAHAHLKGAKQTRNRLNFRLKIEGYRNWDKFTKRNSQIIDLHGQ